MSTSSDPWLYTCLVNALLSKERRFGLLHVLSMVVQDAFPVEFTESSDEGAPFLKGILWCRNVQYRTIDGLDTGTSKQMACPDTWFILDPDTGTIEKMVGIDACQIKSWWGVRIRAPSGVNVEPAFDIADGHLDMSTIDFGNYEVVRPKNRMRSYHHYRYCIDCNTCRSGAGGIMPSICQLLMRTDSSDPSISAAAPFHKLMEKEVLFDTMAVAAISNGMAHHHHCVEGKPRYTMHLPCVCVSDSRKEMKAKIHRIRNGEDDVHSVSLLGVGTSEVFEKRHTYTAYRNGHYATLEILEEDRVIVVYEGLSLENDFAIIAEYVLYKYGIISVDTAIEMTTLTKTSRHCHKALPELDDKGGEWTIVSVDVWNRLIIYSKSRLYCRQPRPKAHQVEYPRTLCGVIALNVLPRIWSLSDRVRVDFNTDTGSPVSMPDPIYLKDEVKARKSLLDRYNEIFRSLHSSLIVDGSSATGSNPCEGDDVINISDSPAASPERKAPPLLPSSVAGTRRDENAVVSSVSGLLSTAASPTATASTSATIAAGNAPAAKSPAFSGNTSCPAASGLLTPAASPERKAPPLLPASVAGTRRDENAVVSSVSGLLSTAASPTATASTSATIAAGNAPAAKSPAFSGNTSCPAASGLLTPAASPERKAPPLLPASVAGTRRDENAVVSSVSGLLSTAASPTASASTSATIAAGNAPVAMSPAFSGNTSCPAASGLLNAATDPTATATAAPAAAVVATSPALAGDMSTITQTVDPLSTPSRFFSGTLTQELPSKVIEEVPSLHQGMGISSPNRQHLTGSAGVSALPYFKDQTDTHVRFNAPPNTDFELEYGELEPFVDFCFDSEGKALCPRWVENLPNELKKQRGQLFTDGVMSVAPLHVAFEIDRHHQSVKEPLSYESGWHNLSVYFMGYCGAVKHEPPCPTKMVVGISRQEIMTLTTNTSNKHPVKVSVLYGSKKGIDDKACVHQKRTPYGRYNGASRHNQGSKMVDQKLMPARHSKLEAKRFLDAGGLIQNRQRGVFTSDQARNLKPEEKSRRRLKKGLSDVDNLGNIFRMMSLHDEEDMKKREKLAIVNKADADIDEILTGSLRYMQIAPHIMIWLYRYNSLLLYVWAMASGVGVLHLDGTGAMLYIPEAPRGTDLIHNKMSISLKHAALSALLSGTQWASKAVSPAVVAECISNRNRQQDLLRFLQDFVRDASTVGALHQLLLVSPALVLLDCDIAQLKAVISVYCQSISSRYHYHNQSFRLQLHFDYIMFNRMPGQNISHEIATLHATAKSILDIFIVLCRPHIVRAVKQRSKHLNGRTKEGKAAIRAMVVQSMRQATDVPYMTVAICSVSVVVAILETKQVTFDINKTTDISTPSEKESERHRARAAETLRSFIIEKAKALAKPLSDDVDAAMRHDEFYTVHDEIIDSVKFIMPQLIQAHRSKDVPLKMSAEDDGRVHDSTQEACLNDAPPTSIVDPVAELADDVNTNHAEANASSAVADAAAAATCLVQDSIAASTASAASSKKKKKLLPNSVRFNVVFGYQESRGTITEVDTAFSEEKGACEMLCNLEEEGSTSVASPLYSPEAAKYLRWWLKFIAFTSKGLLSLHEMFTGCEVQGNNMLAKALFKDAKHNNDVDQHLDSVAEYLGFWNQKCDADVIKAAEQIGELPARTRKRDRISQARAKGKKTAEEEEEEDESMWSRRGTSERESTTLRRELKLSEFNIHGRLTVGATYDALVDWLAKTKRKQKEEIFAGKEMMSKGHFGKWYGATQQMLSENDRWRKNIKAFIQRPKPKNDSDGEGDGDGEPLAKRKKVEGEGGAQSMEIG